ncbi:MAG TPA: hypothetical protein VH092_19455 [Urbifossiella sp.]|nr:hypothetical protein [Urbifossiella sp.]
MPSIDGGQRDPPLADPVAQRPVEHGVEHRPARGRLEQPRGGLLGGGEVGDDPQIDLPGRVGMIGEAVGEAAIVEARGLLEHQAGEQLVLGELLGAELVPVGGERMAGGVAGDPEDPARGSAGGHIS